MPASTFDSTVISTRDSVDIIDPGSGSGSSATKYYYVSFKSGENGGISPTGTRSVSEFTSVQCVAFPSSGYQFSHFKIENVTDNVVFFATTNPYSVIVRGNLVITAYFISSLCTITYVSDSEKYSIYSGAVSTPMSQINSITPGTKIYLRCVMKNNYIFHHWNLIPTGAITFNGAYDLLMTSPNGLITSNVKIGVVCCNGWEYDNNTKYYTLAVAQNIPAEQYFITSKKLFFTVKTKIVLKSYLSGLGGSDDAGIFLTKYLFTYENFEDDFKLSQQTDKYYNADAYATAMMGARKYLAIIDNVEGGCYIYYKNGANTNIRNGYVSYAVFVQPEWVDETDDAGEWRRLSQDPKDDTKYELVDTLITIPIENTATIELVANTGNNSYIELSGPKSYQMSGKNTQTIQDLPSGNYIIKYVHGVDDIGEDNYVKYRITLQFKQKFQVNFYVDDSLDYQLEAYVGAIPSKVSIPAKIGHLFLGWFEGAENVSSKKVFNADGTPNTGNVSYFTNGKWSVAEDSTLNLYAYFEPIKYTIRFDRGADDATGKMADIECEYTKSYKLTNKFQRNGYDILYWLCEKDNKTYEDESEVMDLTTVNGDVVVMTAVWKIISNRGSSLVADEYNKLSVCSVKSRISKVDDMTDIKITNPDSVNSLDVFTVSPVVIQNGSNSITSVELVPKFKADDFSLRILNRYSGYYNPIFKDILFYDNFSESDIFSNTAFDPDYADDFGSFGIINDMWFHKVNETRYMGILGDLEPCYPLSGQYALDFADYNIFSSNWDIGYHTRQLDLEHSEKCSNIGSMKDGLCMFGSKYLNTPDMIEIECFDIGDGIEWDEGRLKSEYGGEVMVKELGSNVNFYFFLHRRIRRFLREKLRPEFKKYINPERSYGEAGLDDDIDEYIEKNVIRLYELTKIRTFVRREKAAVPDSGIENEYEKYLGYDIDNLKKNGFHEIKNVSLSKITTDDFDRKLVYNMRTGEKESFGFSFIITKI